MAKTLSIGILGGLALAVGGCGAELDKPIVTFERNSSIIPPLKTADQKGLYALFPGNGIDPLDAAYLNPGDQYGFERADGRIVGVYFKSKAPKTIPLDGVLTTEYIWKYRGDKQP